MGICMPKDYISLKRAMLLAWLGSIWDGNLQLAIKPEPANLVKTR